MYRLTRARNTIRAMSAFREMLLTHVALTSWPLISLTETPARLARAAFNWSALNVGTPVEVGDGAAEAEAEAPADGVTEAAVLGLAEADGVAEGEAGALGEAEADADGLTNGDSEGDGAAAVTPRSVKLRFVLICTHPVGQLPPPMSSVSASVTPNRAMISW